MVTPVSGPFGLAVTNPYVSFVRIWWRQKPPYTLRLPFTLEKFVRVRGSPGVHTAEVGYDSSLAQLALNRCEKKFGGLVQKDSIQWANNLLEAGRGYATVVARLSSLLRFSKAVRRFQFDEAFKHLGITALNDREVVKVKRKLVKEAKNFSNNWLAYKFFLEPTMQDIQNALQVLSSADFGSRQVRARAMAKSQTVYRSTAGGDSINVITDHFCGCQMICSVRIVNPNVFLAQNLGFASPGSILWEATPWSFVVDWFANVGQFIGQYDYLMGLSVSDPATTFFQRNTRTEDSYYKFTDEFARTTDLGIHVYRSNGFFPVALEIYRFKGFSPVRGITAASLLVRYLRG